MHNLWIPAAAIAAVFGLIIGNQMLADSRRDAQLAELIRERLETPGEVTLSNLTQVNKGYGLCGEYRQGAQAKAPFYYHTVTEHLALGGETPSYRDNCANISH